MDVLIFERYAGLVRQGSVFWDTSEVNVRGGLKGVEVDIESLRAIATGGIEFATPSEKSPRVKPGTVFFLRQAEGRMARLAAASLPPDKNPQN